MADRGAVALAGGLDPVTTVPRAFVGRGRGGKAAGDGQRIEQALQDRLQKHWKTVVRKRPPAAREAWLNSTEVRNAWDAKRINLYLDAIEDQRQEIRASVPGGAWLAAWENAGQAFPPGGFPVHQIRDEVSVRVERKVVHVKREKVRKRIGGTAMVLSRQRVGLGRDQSGLMSHETLRTRRWLPPQCASIEDTIDGLTFDGGDEEWKYTRSYVSISALVIQQVGATRGHEEVRQLHLAPDPAGYRW